MSSEKKRGRRSSSDKPWANTLRVYSPDSRRSPRKKTATPVTNQSQSTCTLSPEPSIQLAALTSVLKSCLKSKSIIEKSSRRSVIFGSPNVAEFNAASPTNKMTPMTRGQAKHLFSMDGKSKEAETSEDPVTEENSRELDEWDRLTNVSEGSNEGDEVSEMSSPPSINVSRRRGRRASKIQVSADKLSENESSPHDEFDSSNVSNTVALPDSLGALLNDNTIVGSGRNSLLSEVETTQKLEGDLNLLLQNVNGTFNENKEESQNEADQTMDVDEEDVTTTLEHDLGALIAQVEGASEQQNTVQNDIISQKRIIEERQMSMKQRLQSLNAVAKQNHLDQCATPSTLGPFDRMSLGMKRHSMLALPSVNNADIKRARLSVIENINPSVQNKIEPFTRQAKSLLQLKDSLVTVDKALTLESLYKSNEIIFPQMPEATTTLLKFAKHISLPSTVDCLADSLKADLNNVISTVFESTVKEITLAHDSIKAVDSNLWTTLSTSAFMKKNIEKSLLGEEPYKSCIKAISNEALYSGQQTIIGYENGIMSTIVDKLKELKSCKIQEVQTVCAEQESLKETLQTLKQKVTEAKIRLETRKLELADAYESGKNKVIALVEKSIENPRQPWAIEKRLVEDPSTINSTTNAAKQNEVNATFEEAIKTASVLNKLSYCKLVSYQNSNIEFEVSLTAFLKASLHFNISENPTSGEMCVSEVQLDLLPNLVSCFSFTTRETQEMEFSKLFFHSVMKNHDSFKACKIPSDIPKSLQWVRKCAICICCAVSV